MRPFVRTLIRFDAIDSTSSEARRRLASGVVGPLPWLIRADRQTAGRGRGENAWWSADGSLLFTLVFDPADYGLNVSHEPRLALVAALALIDAIGPCSPGPDPGIRWPNDVEAGGKKLAGILPERVETSNGPKFLLGVGINVATDFRSAPEAIRAMATSVADLCAEELRVAAHGGDLYEFQFPFKHYIQFGPKQHITTLQGSMADLVSDGPRLDTDALLVAFLQNFETELARLANDDPDLIRRWNDADQLAGRSLALALPGRQVVGVGRGIDALGGLRIEIDAAGREETFYGGQVLRER